MVASVVIMHGLVNKAIEAFVVETYGAGLWANTMARAELGFDEFEAMLQYEPAVTSAVIRALETETGRSQAALLEDLGTCLVTSPSLPALRRLLRFSGVTYVDFLLSLEELADRVRLAVSDLRLPTLVVTDLGEGQFRLTCEPGWPGYGDVMLGVLRAMADDYGALAMLEREEARPHEGDTISIRIVEDAFAAGKTFALGARSA